jgi:predicted RNA-binding Zn-ribbon protein involved in translation (DUF1610 family)
MYFLKNNDKIFKSMKIAGFCCLFLAATALIITILRDEPQISEFSPLQNAMMYVFIVFLILGSQLLFWQRMLKEKIKKKAQNQAIKKGEAMLCPLCGNVVITKDIVTSLRCTTCGGIIAARTKLKHKDH